MDPRVEAYILDLQLEEQKFVFLLREKLMNAAPGVEEAFKWKVPFYSYYGALCFINRTKKGVEIGFVHGNEIEETFGLLEDRGTKQVRHLPISNQAQLLTEEFDIILQQALIVNEDRKKRGAGW